MSEERPLPADIAATLAPRLRKWMKLGQDEDPVLVFVNSWEMDATRRTVLCFRPGVPHPAFVAKVARGAGRKILEAEHENLRRLERSGEEELLATIPRVIDWFEQADGHVLVESVARGTPLSRDLGHWDAERLARAGSQWLLLLHRATAEMTVLDDEVFDRLFAAPLEGYLAHFEPDEGERGLLARALDTASLLRGHSMPLTANHGDFYNRVFASRRIPD
jgi:hypothetical protein